MHRKFVLPQSLGAISLSTLLLAGCGAEAVGSAATGAAIKKQELERAQAQGDTVQRQLNEALQQGQQRQQALDDAAK